MKELIEQILTVETKLQITELAIHCARMESELVRQEVKEFQCQTETQKIYTLNRNLKRITVLDEKITQAVKEFNAGRGL